MILSEMKSPFHQGALRVLVLRLPLRSDIGWTLLPWSKSIILALPQLASPHLASPHRTMNCLVSHNALRSFEIRSASRATFRLFYPRLPTIATLRARVDPSVHVVSSSPHGSAFFVSMCFRSRFKYPTALNTFVFSRSTHSFSISVITCSNRWI